MNSFFDAFISYGRADSKAFATKLYNNLISQGLKVWFDQNDIPLGVDFQNQIYDGIEKADNFIFIIAPHSVKSPYCLKEIVWAVKHNKRIIPLLHVEPNDCWDKMHPTIGKINWVYFREEIDDFEASFTGLINLIRKHADYVEQHTQFLVKALEWERNQKQNSCLLIGEERVQAESWLKIRFKDEQPPCEPTDLHCEFICESTKNANNLLTQVFLSYSEQDKDFMKKIKKTLMREGFTVWTNKTDVKTGTAFQEAIHQGIEQADNVVHLISPHSLQSKFCHDELTHAFANNKRLISLLIEPTDIEQIPPELKPIQFINFTGHDDEEQYRIDANKLIKILKQDAHYYEQHKILLVKALKWLRQNRNPSILLRGYDLQHARTWLNVAQQRKEHSPLPLHEEFITESVNQPPDSSLEVFISYSRVDSDFARKLNEALQIQGKTTWFDQESIASGTDFQQEIYRGIENSANFLFIISPRSVNSPYCAGEVEYAQTLNKRIVTVLHREVSGKDLHPALARVQWIDFNRHGGDFYANFGELVRTLDTDREHVYHHTKLLQRAIEWQEKGKSNDLVLRGSEFALAENWLQEAEQQNKQPPATDLQKEYVSRSREVVLAEIKKAKHQAIISRSFGLVSAAFVVSIGVLVFAFSQWRRAEFVQEGQINALSRFSILLNVSNQAFDALIEAIRAGGQLQKQQDRVKPETESRVLTALQGVVYQYGFRERDRWTGHKAGVNYVVWSPDGQILATASRDYTVKLQGLDGTLLQTLTGHTASVNSVSFSPDGKTLATASADNTVKLWSVEGKLLQSLRGHNAAVTRVIWSPDGKTLATASADKTIKLWSVEGKELQTLRGHNDVVSSISFSPDSKTLASASADNTVKLWRSDGTLLQTLTGHTNAVTSVSFNPDGRTLASASADKTLKVWSIEGTELLTFPGYEAGVNSLAWNPDGKTLATASADNTIKLWSIDGRLLQTLAGHEAAIASINFSPDGKTLASASADKTIKLWSQEGEKLPTLIGHIDAIASISFSPDGKTLATASADNTAKLWSVEGKELQTLRGHNAAVTSVSFNPNSKILVTASADKTVKLWSLDGSLLQTLTEHSDKVTSVAWSPDGKTLASASADRTIKLWNVEGKLLQTLTMHNAVVDSLTFSPDGKTLACASADKTVKLWSVENKEILTPINHDAVVDSVSFSPDGKILASASADNTVKLWSKDGTLLRTLTGHSDKVTSVAWSPDGKILASASADNTVKLWNKDGEELLTLTGHNAPVNSISFSPDGKTIASASADNTAILWNLNELHLDKLMMRACEQVRDYLKNRPQGDSDRTLCNDIGTRQ